MGALGEGVGLLQDLVGGEKGSGRRCRVGRRGGRTERGGGKGRDEGDLDMEAGEGRGVRRGE